MNKVIGVTLMGVDDQVGAHLLYRQSDLMLLNIRQGYVLQSFLEKASQLG